jgi:hypothetical protein
MNASSGRIQSLFHLSDSLTPSCLSPVSPLMPFCAPAVGSLRRSRFTVLFIQVLRWIPCGALLVERLQFCTSVRLMRQDNGMFNGTRNLTSVRGWHGCPALASSPVCGGCRNYSEGRGANCQGGQQAAQAPRFLIPGLRARLCSAG